MICFISFLTHTFIIGYYEVYPSETTTRFIKRRLDLIEFPVLFKVCLNPAFDEDKFRKFGYDNLWNFFLGRSVWTTGHGARVYGWAGHQENGSTLSSPEGDIPNFNR